MSDFAKFCPKCYAFFRDPDLYAKHVEVCGFAKKTAESRRQTAAEVKKDRKRQTAGETADCRRQTAADASGEEIQSESAAEGGLPSADSTEGGLPQVKPSKFKT